MHDLFHLCNQLIGWSGSLKKLEPHRSIGNLSHGFTKLHLTQTNNMKPVQNIELCKIPQITEELILPCINVHQSAQTAIKQSSSLFCKIVTTVTAHHRSCAIMTQYSILCVI